MFSSMRIKYCLRHFENHINIRSIFLLSINRYLHSTRTQLLKKNVPFLEPPWKIMFFGSDSFAVRSLQLLCSKFRTGTLIQDLQVTTNFAVDWNNKPNPVYQFADSEKLSLHEWPVSVEELNQKFDLGIVVSFGYLIPRDVIDSFSLGILNVHGSVLPKWRGAAPIMRAIMNGDTETGVTIMKIDPDKFDTGHIVRQYSVTIPHNETAEELTDRLADVGSRLLMECVRDLPRCLEHTVPQPTDGVSYAKKIDESTAEVEWTEKTAEDVYNLFRAISHIYPLTTTWFGHEIKLLDIVKDDVSDLNPENSAAANQLKIESHIFPGLVEYSKRRKILRIQCKDGRWVCVKNVTVTKKKTMSAAEFYNGFISKIMNCLDRKFMSHEEKKTEKARLK